MLSARRAADCMWSPATPATGLRCGLANECDLDVPAAQYSGAVRPGATPHRQTGQPRTKGQRLGNPADLAASATWSAHHMVIYHGRTGVKHIATVRCLWYGSFRTRPVTVLLVRDEALTSGYDLALD